MMANIIEALNNATRGALMVLPKTPVSSLVARVYANQVLLLRGCITDPMTRAGLAGQYLMLVDEMYRNNEAMQIFDSQTLFSYSDLDECTTLAHRIQDNYDPGKPAATGECVVFRK